MFYVHRSWTVYFLAVNMKLVVVKKKVGSVSPMSFYKIVNWKWKGKKKTACLFYYFPNILGNVLETTQVCSSYYIPKPNSLCYSTEGIHWYDHYVEGSNTLKGVRTLVYKNNNEDEPKCKSDLFILIFRLEVQF